MSNVLVRNVPDEDLELLREAAANEGVSLQNYLLDAVHAKAAYLRRQSALIKLSDRLEGEHVPADERQAALEAIDDAGQERQEQLVDRTMQ